MTIDADTNVGEFFRALVHDTVRERGFNTSSAGESYLAGLLADCANPETDPLRVIGGESLTLMLARALEDHGARRFQRLRLLGDGLLYVSGFFSEHLERRGLEPDYVSGLGSTAYGRAASMLRRAGQDSSGPDVLAELADNFDTFVQVTAGVSEQLSAHSVRDNGSLLDVYERWLKSPSSALAEMLAAQGLLPQRAKPGVH